MNTLTKIITWTIVAVVIGTIVYSLVRKPNDNILPTEVPPVTASSESPNQSVEIYPCLGGEKCI